MQKVYIYTRLSQLSALKKTGPLARFELIGNDIHINMVSKDIYKRLWDNLKPNGFKFVQNNGSLQEVKHYHLHLIPVFDNEPGDKKDLKNVLEKILK